MKEIKSKSYTLRGGNEEAIDKVIIITDEQI